MTGPDRPHWRIATLLVMAALAVTLQEYLGPRLTHEWFPYDPSLPARQGSLARTGWWTVWSLLGYVVLPMAAVLALPGERLRDHHLSPRGLGPHAAKLTLGLAVVVGGVWLLSTTAGFRDLYPQFRQADRAAADQALWMALVAVQMIALEYFFRGYLLGGMRAVMGENAVWMAMVPYVMLHFGKPMAEVLAAIPIAVGLGLLAMRTGSIWAGAALQIALAWTMDPARPGRASPVDWSALAGLGLPAAAGVLGLAAVIALLAWARARDHWTWRVVARLTVEQWRAIDADGGPGSPGAAPPGRADWKVAVILLVVAVVLTLQEYVGQRAQYERWWPYDPTDPDPYWSLYGYGWWTAWRVGGYLLLPMLVVALLPGERLRDYYLSPRGFFKHLWIYALMFALILPAVIIASRTPEFRQTYPFYRLAPRSAFDTWSWEVMYALQFLSLEFFFRGFLLHALRRVMGASAIFVMIVPYCFIHFGKPMAETVGAIFAGVILGTLAMRTRSIWGGVVIHVGVAWTMDLLAIAQCPTDGRPCPR
ncbi:MAG: CPBP family intramembrane metalloprotease [Kofleriaceae bacterium]|nr:CPBP family intramembrane metalloprotease [Kofleriaceae bacterium]MCL4223894.1 CPBP family intramembrane metalloprotease [Myxococcales bacterium]